MKELLTTYQRIIGILQFIAGLLLIVSLAFPWPFSQPLFAIWLILWILEGRWCSRSNFLWSKALYPVLFLCGFVVWESVSLLWSHDLPADMSEIGRHWPVFAIMLMALFGLNTHYKAYRMKTALIAGSLLSIVSYSVVCYQHICTGTLLSNPPYWYGSMWTLFGEGPIEVLKHRCFYCLVLLMSLVFSVDVYRHFRTLYPALYTGITIGMADALILTAILLTASRTALLLLPLVGIVMLMMNYAGAWRKYIAIGIILLFAGLAAFNLRYNTHFEATRNDLSLLLSGDKDALEQTSEPRIEIYACALRHWDENGFWGVGFGGSDRQIRTFYAADGMERCMANGYHVHSRFIKVWMEMGPLALIAMLFILFSAPFFHSGRARYDTACMSLIFGGAMLLDNVLSTMGTLYTFFVLVAVIQAEQREADSLPPAHP